MEQKKGGVAEFKSQIMLLVLIIVMASNFILALTLMQTTTRLKLVAQVITPELSRTDQTLRFSPLESSSLYDTEMEELFVRAYLDWRLTYFPDEAEMMYRWGPGGPVWFLSSQRVFGQFFKGKKWLEEYVKDHHATQSIDIKSMYHLDNVWTVEVDVYTFEGETVTTQTYVINLKTTDRGRVSRSQRMMNPKGFMVIEYSANVKRG